MTSLLKATGRKSRFIVICLTALSLLALAAFAQKPMARITKQIDNTQRAAIPNSHLPMVRAENDAGHVPPNTTLKGITLVFTRTAAQQADLEALIAAQQDPSSPLYHKWITPDQFAARFGVADSDIAKVTSWLQQQGFSIDEVARSKDRIIFSGTVGQVEAAFGTELHYYKVGGVTHFAPSQDLTVPVALSSVVQTVKNLSTFRPRSHVKLKAPQPAPRFTSSQSGSHFLTPGDVATIYDIAPAYKAGYTGTGQAIAVVGQSAIALSDIEHFQSAAGLATKDPTVVLVPNSGTSVINSGDEAESDLDVQYSGGIATGASIFFVYVGNSANYSVLDALQYAIETRIAPVIAISYGVCESQLSSNDYTTLNNLLAQAASQGQSVISATGDNGSTDCYGITSLTTAQQQALAVDFPGSSEYVTGMGGTEFPSANVASSNTTYWTAANGSDVISSALSYIPEQVWNDDSSANGLGAGGGGASTFTPRPSWQTSVSPSGSFRLVPDISLSASPANAGYLYCSSDSSTNVSGSCSNSFRDTNNTYLTVAGGTSFGAPIFAGMVAIINQKMNSTGQGVVNSTLYSLAANSTTYASAFHDVTSGGNQCTAGATYCSSAGASQYAAGTGYDEASGLGSVDFYNLLNAWPAGSSLTASITTLSAATTSPASGAADAITVTVGSGSTSSTATPTGTVTIAIDGTSQGSPVTLSNGATNINFSSSTAGAHVITATYSGDSTYASSTGTLVVNVPSSTPGFTISGTNVSVTSGSSGTSTITITPTNGYTGTIKWTVTSNPTLTNGCASIPSTTVSGSAAVTATMTVSTSASACASSSALGWTGNGQRSVSAGLISSRNETKLLALVKPVPLAIALASFLGAALLRVRARRSPIFVGLCVVLASGLTISCGGGSNANSQSSSSASSKVAAGSYTLTIVGTDTATTSIMASTTVTLSVN